MTGLLRLPLSLPRAPAPAPAHVPTCTCTLGMHMHTCTCTCNCNCTRTRTTRISPGPSPVCACACTCDTLVHPLRQLLAAVVALPLLLPSRPSLPRFRQCAVTTNYSVSLYHLSLSRGTPRFATTPVPVPGRSASLAPSLPRFFPRRLYATDIAAAHLMSQTTLPSCCRRRRRRHGTRLLEPAYRPAQLSSVPLLPASQAARRTSTPQGAGCR